MGPFNCVQSVNETWYFKHIRKEIVWDKEKAKVKEELK